MSKTKRTRRHSDFNRALTRIVLRHYIAVGNAGLNVYDIAEWWTDSPSTRLTQPRALVCALRDLRNGHDRSLSRTLPKVRALAKAFGVEVAEDLNDTAPLSALAGEALRALDIRHVAPGPGRRYTGEQLAARRRRKHALRKPAPLVKRSQPTLQAPQEPTATQPTATNGPAASVHKADHRFDGLNAAVAALEVRIAFLSALRDELRVMMGR